MSRLTEIQKAIEELAPEEKEELRDWLDGYDPAVEREWAAIAQERLRQILSACAGRLRYTIAKLSAPTISPEDNYKCR